MLISKPIDGVQKHQRFFYAGRTYMLANEDDRKKHPAREGVTILAYHLPEQGDRVPVTFSPLANVYVQQN